MNDQNNQSDLKTDLDHGRILEWAELYALEAVSDEERSMIDRYIPTASAEERDAFNERVRQAREAITVAYATHEAEPPAGLLNKIMASLPENTSGTAGSGAAGAHGQDELATRRHRRERQPSTARRWLIGAAAAAAIAVGSVTVAQNVTEPSVQERVAEAGDVRSETIEIQAGGTAELAVSESVNAAVVRLQDVPAPPPGKVYQMWRLPASGSAPESVGVMTGEDVSDSSPTVVQGIKDYSAVAITVEPEGGSKSPTLPIVAQIPLES
ncbi:MAG TPA: anti-sigma factor [Arthrobacter sp.]|nr:anti-sigma factor [Arthrobacter sp.]